MSGYFFKNRRASVVIVGMDGLRPDMISNDLMPNLVRFQGMATTMSNHRAVFPTETMVNFASLVTGCEPAQHGVVANTIGQRRGKRLRVYDTSCVADLEAAEERLDGGLYTRRTLAECLAEDNVQLTVMGTGSAGATRMLCDNRELGHRSFSTQDWTTGFPDAWAESILRQFGDPPDPACPDSQAIGYLVDVFFGLIATRDRSPVTILWFNDPDETSHAAGLRSRVLQEALQQCDRAFGRILDWWDGQGRAEQVHLCVLSDHGHVGATGGTAGAASVAEAFRGSETVTASRFVQVFSSSFEQDLNQAINELGQNYFVIPVAPHGSKTEISQSALGCAHSRSPDFVVCTADPDSGMGWLPGRGRSMREHAPGLGLHGGLCAAETACVCFLGGPQFGVDRSVTAPSGSIDVMPTILHVLGLTPPADLDGRVLREALVNAEPNAGTRICIEQLDVGTHPGLSLRLRKYGDQRYIEGVGRW